MFNKKKKFDIEVFILKHVDDFGKVSYSNDKDISGYINATDFLPRINDIIFFKKIYYKVDRIIINYEENSLNILLSESRVDVKMQK
jgi:hypothetical protein